MKFLTWTKKLIFLHFSKPRNKYFFPCKTKHWPYVTLANFPIKYPAHAGIFLSHTTHLTMTSLKPLCGKALANYFVY
ncbi:hypothetical protein DWA18_14895 [Acinetobacter baumannii]|nr:hypothetical protein DWA18_14895 [Acinetobacter baumannii]RSF56402.1 hypothetical protein EGU16_19725 [Acinetobacter baumannii]TDH78253.1 hypothetical protein DWA22_10180 [Acinetobacter baumannii]